MVLPGGCTSEMDKRAEGSRYLRLAESFNYVREDVRSITISTREGSVHETLERGTKIGYEEVIKHLKNLQPDNSTGLGEGLDHREARKDYEDQYETNEKFFRRYGARDSVLKRLEKVSKREPVKLSQMEALIKILLFHTHHYLHKHHYLYID